MVEELFARLWSKQPFSLSRDVGLLIITASLLCGRAATSGLKWNKRKEERTGKEKDALKIKAYTVAQTPKTTRAKLKQRS
jgi:hypothetical protein